MTIGITNLSPINKKIEYIEIPSLIAPYGAYIVTDYINDVDIGISMVAKFLTVKNIYSNQYLFGSYSAPSSLGNQFGFNNGYYNTSKPQLYVGGNPMTFFDFGITQNNTSYNLYYSNLYNDGDFKFGPVENPVVKNSYSLSPLIKGNKIIIFAISESGSNPSDAEAKYLKITKGNSLIFDGIPVILKGEVGFYDKEKKILLKSTSGVSFIQPTATQLMLTNMGVESTSTEIEQKAQAERMGVAA